MVVEEKIIVEASFKDKLSQGFAKLKTNIRSFSNVMAMPLTQFREMNTAGNSLGRIQQNLATKGGILANRFRLLTHGMRGFRMEMLGVMFFGMGMQRFFMGLLQPVLDVFGAFDLLRIALISLFLPFAEKNYDKFLDFVQKIIDLPDSTKLLIGDFTAWGVGIGTVLFLVGMLTLGLGSMTLVFNGAGAAALAFTKNLGIVVGIATAAYGVFEIMNGKMKGIGTIIMGVGLALLAFNPILGIVIFAVGLAARTIIDNWDFIKQRTVDIWHEIERAIQNSINWIIDKVNWMINQLNRLPGININPIANVDWHIPKSVTFGDNWQKDWANQMSMNPNMSVPSNMSRSPNMSTAPNMSTGVNISQNFNIAVSDKAEFDRMLNDYSKKLVDDIKRQVNTS